MKLFGTTQKMYKNLDEKKNRGKAETIENNDENDEQYLVDPKPTTKTSNFGKVVKKKFLKDFEFATKVVVRAICN